MPSQGKRQDIVEAATRLLAAKGAAGVTAAALATEAGVSKANIFHHFDTLDDVVLSAFEQFLLGMAAFAPKPGATLRQWLLDLGSETVALMEEHRRLAGAYLAFAGRAISDPRLRLRMAETAALAEDGFAAAIAGLAPGRFTPAGTKTLASLILVTGDGLAIHRHLFPERAPQQDRAWRAFVDHVAPEES